MSKPQQLTFPWNKPNKSTFDEFYFDKNNLAIKDILFVMSSTNFNISIFKKC